MRKVINMSKLEFTWITEQVDVGSYQCRLIETDDSGNIHVLRLIDIEDFNSPVNQEWDRKWASLPGPQLYRTHCYSVSIWDNHHGKLFQEFHIDPTEDPTKPWYTGTPKHTVKELKKWSERYVAASYIKEYKARMKRIRQLEELVNEFWCMGFTAKVEKLQ